MRLSTTLVPLAVRRFFKAYGPNFLVLALFLLGLHVLQRILHEVNIHDVYLQFKAIPVQRIALACLLSAAAYLVLVGYDWTAFRYIKKKIPLPLIAFTSITSFSLSNTIGASWLSGGAVRYRMYSGVGVDASDIAMIIAFYAVGFATAEVLIGGGALLLHPEVLQDYLPVSTSFVRVCAALALSFLVGLLIVRSMHKGEIRIGKRHFQLPRIGLLLGQVSFSLLDIALSGAVLFVLLPDHSVPFLAYIVAFALALIVGALSHVPGGIGVFEAVMAMMLGHYVSLDILTAALIGHRVIYYLLPFVFGVTMLAGSEAFRLMKRRAANKSESTTTLKTTVNPVLTHEAAGKAKLGDDSFSYQTVIATVARFALPPALSGLALLMGVALLYGSSVPLRTHTLQLFHKVMPLELLEFSHLLGGVAGTLLIILSFALWQRVRAALWLTSGLVLLGAVLSFIQTLDYDRTLVMLLVVVLLYTCQSLFYRRARLFSGSVEPVWFLLTLAALAGFIWLLFFSFKSVPYRTDLWWQFAIDAQAPRGLRTAVMAIATFIIVYVITALKPPRRAIVNPSIEELAQVKPVVAQQDNIDGNFVFSGDKQLLLSDNRQSFLMFAIRNRSWVALGDPISRDDTESVELIWEFKRLAAKERGNAVFYQVGKENLAWYVDAGFQLYKLGEEARVNLSRFSMEGPARSKLRQARSKATREGLTFEVAYPPHSAERLAELRTISDSWLGLKSAREKSFSLGRFDEDYLQHFPLALIHEHGELTAFANVFVTDTKQEATIDLMRHRPHAEKNTMDFLFVELILYLQAEGYLTFSLGMAPLSGFVNDQTARLWDRFGMLVYKKGGRFYNFEGLRHFKAKFDPDWEPRYLATTQKGVTPLLTLVDIAGIISGGVRGVFGK